MLFTVNAYPPAIGDVQSVREPVIAVGAGATGIRTSDGAVSWQTITLPDSAAAHYVKFGGGRYVCIGTGTATAISLDKGATWSAGGNMPASKTWCSLGYSPTLGSGMGRWVALNNNATDTAAAYSDDGGASWSATTIPASAGNGRSQIVWSGDEERFITRVVQKAVVSDDGINWSDGGSTLVSLGTNVSGAIWTPVSNRVIFPSANGSVTVALLTQTGASFTSATTSEFGTAVTYTASNRDGTLLCMTASGSPNRTWASTDGGDNWTAGALAGASNWPMVHDGEKFIAVALGFDSQTSVDGVNWSAAGTPGVSSTWDSMATAEYLF